MMTRLLSLVCMVISVAFLPGCAHQITMSGDLANLVGSGQAKIEKGVGLNITDDYRKLEVTGPGGGGDKVRYLPYRDIESGLYAALSESFSRVTRLNGESDPKVKTESLSYVLTPSISTTSSSPSPFTWPPTIFTIELTCKITDAEGRPVTEVRALGEGKAEFNEFKGDFSLSAKRAADDVLRKLIKALGDAAPLLR